MPTETLPDVSSNPPCADCHGKCCRSYYVPVTGYDVWRISTTQRLSPEHYVIAGHQDKEHSDAFLLSTEARAYFLALDKKGKFHRYSPCIFLIEFGDDKGRCGIYAGRPTTCRTYPMTIKHGAVQIHSNAACPPGAWSPEEMARPEWREATKTSYMEFDIYSEVVKRWNALVTYSAGREFTLHEYLSYLMNVYDQLAPLDESIPTEEMERVRRTWPTPPRAGANLEEMRLCRGDLPWLDYLCRAREVIDRFYPHVPPQPILVPMVTEEQPTESDALQPPRP